MFWGHASQGRLRPDWNEKRLGYESECEHHGASPKRSTVIKAFDIPPTSKVPSGASYFFFFVFSMCNCRSLSSSVESPFSRMRRYRLKQLGRKQNVTTLRKKYSTILNKQWIKLRHLQNCRVGIAEWASCSTSTPLAGVWTPPALVLCISLWFVWLECSRGFENFVVCSS